MSESDPVTEAAQLLLDTRAERRRIDALPDDLRPTTIEEGYAIQHRGHELRRAPLGPWKVGATSVAAQEVLGVDGPFLGRIERERVIPTAGSITVDEWFVGPPVVEVEIGLVPHVDLAEVPEDPLDLAGSVTVVPCIELVNARYADMTTVGAPSLVADNAVASALVRGDDLELEVSIVRALDELPVALHVDDEEIATGVGGAALDHPLAALALAAQIATGWGTPIATGELVITGTCTGVYDGAAGQHLVARFGPATVEIDLV